MTKEQLQRIQHLLALKKEGGIVAVQLAELQEYFHNNPDLLKAEEEKVRIEYQKLVGKPGQDGRDGKNGKDGKPGPQGERGETGRQGKDGRNGKDGLNGEDGLDGSPDFPKDIRDKLSSLKGDDRLSASAIKDLPTVVRELPQISLIGRGGGTHLTVTSAGVSMGQDIHKINFIGLDGYRSGDGSVTLTVDPSSVGYTVENQTSATLNETATEGLVVILCDCTANNITINLPTAVGNTAQITIKKTDASVNTVTIDGAGTEKVDDGLTAVLRKQYESVTLVTDQSNWFVI